MIYITVRKGEPNGLFKTLAEAEAKLGWTEEFKAEYGDPVIEVHPEVPEITGHMIDDGWHGQIWEVAN